MLTIRSEQNEDADAIHAVHTAAFPTGAEARLVDALRESGNTSVSVVAVLEGKIVGHVLFSPVSIEPTTGTTRGAGLAPVAIRPEHQHRGIGTALIEQGIAACRGAPFDFIVVLGAPAYYHRFGFRRALATGLANEYGVDEEFMVLELRPGSLSGLRGLVRYAPEFATLAEENSD
jgi:putative acetyltransferase